MKRDLGMIIGSVAIEFGIKPDLIQWGSNSANEVTARSVAMLLARESLKLSYPQLGKAFGCRHHTTCIHGIRKISARMIGDSELRESVANLCTALRIENKWAKNCC